MSEAADRARIVADGTMATIEYAVRSNGSMAAKEFIATLTETDQRRLAVLFKRLADIGRIMNREQFKRVEGPIWEFKRHQVRVACFQIGKRWLLTHGFRKKGDHWKPSELDRATRIMNEHLEREKRTSR